MSLKLGETTSDGQHAHLCKKCNNIFDCPGLTVSLECGSREDSKCIHCSKHINCIDAWFQDRSIKCHDCGNDLIWDKESPVDIKEYERAMYNPYSSFICSSCFEKGRANGTIHTVDEFFDKFSSSLAVEQDGEIHPVTIIDALPDKVN